MEENQVKKLKLNVTNIRSVLIDSNKELKKIKSEKNNLISSQIKKREQKSKEERLESKVTGLTSLKNIGKSIASGPMSLFDKLMEFAGIILLGIVVNNLPTIISKIQTFFSENAWWINGIIDIGKFVGKSILVLADLIAGTNMSGIKADRSKIDADLKNLKGNLGDIESQKKKLDDALNGKGVDPAKLSLLGDLPKPVKRAKGGPVSQTGGTTSVKTTKSSSSSGVSESGRAKRARQTTNYFGTFDSSIKVAKETSSLDEKNLESFTKASENMKEFFKNLTKGITPVVTGPGGPDDIGPGAGIGIPVDPNEVVGKAGSTGLSTGVHIHFEHLGKDKKYLPAQVRDNIFVGGRKLSSWIKTSEAGIDRLHPVLGVTKYHAGEDWAGMPLGAPITLGPGLKYVNYASDNGSGYGNSVIIEDNDGKRYRLAHLSGGPVNLGALKAKQASSQQISSNFIVTDTIKGKQASWYGPGFYGKTTASGEVYMGNEMTAAHPTLPFGTFVKVTNLNNNKSVIVRINDRGPFEPDLVTPHKTRIIDLSKAAADHIGLTGVAPVNFEVLTPKAKITPTKPDKNKPSSIFNWNQSSSNTEGSTTVLTAFVPVEKYIPYGIPQIIERKVPISTSAPVLSDLWGTGA